MRTGDESSATLVACPDLETYARVAEAGLIPILGEPDALAGFPPGTTAATSVDGAGPPIAAPDGDADPTRAIVALDDPSCLAIARFLAAATGRSLHTTATADVERDLDALLAAGPLRSLTFVVPSWSADDPSPRWLQRVLLAARERATALDGVAWGILTATDPATLSRLAAKAVLHRAIAAAYREHPTLVFTTGSAGGLGAFAPPIGSAPGAPIELVERPQFLSREALAAVGRPWSLMFFSDHGRGYCGAQGYLCGARSLRASPTAPTSCVAGMECVSPADGAYAPGMARYEQIDPRRYDTPVLVSDCCGSGNWSDPAWDAGHPSLVFHALAGAASVVVTSDQVTFGLAGGAVDVLWAFRTGANVGDAVARLNRCRRGAAAEFPFFVLGDPESAAGPERWPRWAADAEVEAREDGARVVVEPPAASGFVRVPLGPTAAADRSTFVHARSPGTNVRHVWSCSDGVEDEVWLVVGQRGASPGPIELAIERAPGVDLDPATVRAAVELPARVRHWHAADPAAARRTPALTEEVAPLQRAADQLLRIHRSTRAHAGRASVGHASDVAMAVELAESSWRQAHAEVVERVRDRVSPSGTWPPRLWPNVAPRARHVDAPCPRCGEAPTLRRVYQTVLGPAREAWECVRCVLLRDGPHGDPLDLELRAAPELHVGETLTATVSLGPARARRIGAVAIYPDTRAHGVRVLGPPTHALDLRPGATQIVEATLELTAPPPVHHRIYLRALILLDATWFILGRPLTIRPAR